MEDLPAQLQAATIHFDFSIFKISLPNLIVGVVLIAIFFLAAWARLPRFLEHARGSGKED
jgi:small-conductance mechanosensitive channel